MKKVNFYGGPAILPQQVLEQAQQAIQNFEGTGLSILEVSHRSKEFVAVMNNARLLVKEILGLDENKEVLFLQGGALSQFHTIPYNLLNPDETAAYFDTGTWANGALTEARNFGKVEVVCSSKDKNYSYIPSLNVNEWQQAKGKYKYVHLTTNNTIYGTQLLPSNYAAAEGNSLIADMSSDIFSRQIDYNKFDLIYAGAQKNMGAAGTTLVVVNKNILGKVDRPIPKMLDYRKHIEAESMLNTPSVFAVYVAYLTLLWIKEQGLAKIEEVNNRKAKSLYQAIDNSTIFEGIVAKENRSLMNVCFNLKDKSLSDKFLNFIKQNGIVGLEGHRSVGGFRASIYNAMPESGVAFLIDTMKQFESAL